MALDWGGISQVRGDMDEALQAEARETADRLGAEVLTGLDRLSLPRHRSLHFRPFNLACMRDGAGFLFAFSPASGMADRVWLHHPEQTYAPEAMVDLTVDQLGWDRPVVFRVPPRNSMVYNATISAQAARHVEDVRLSNRLGALGNLDGVRHLVPAVESFLEDHPDFERNVFVMMSFAESDQLRQVYDSIRQALAARGMNAVRADGRDYTGELWSNVEVYLTGSKYGIAVFEDIDTREFNPNVSLELGYMMGRGKRTLLLKEQRLPRLPTDVVGRLYKAFDSYNIDASVQREVGRWVDVDLGIRAE